MDLKRIRKEHYDEFYVHNLDNLDEMELFLERYNLPNLTHKGLPLWLSW